jgi:cell wall-associated NlpC family hydrolase
MVALCAALRPLPAQTAETSQAPSGPVATLTPTPAPASWSSTSVTTSTPSPGVTVSTTKTAPPHTMAYTVAKGDSLTKLAAKYNTTRKKLEDLNSLTNFKLTPGQVIYVPASAKKLAALSAAKHHPATPVVQDYDIPASTFAGCPVPPSNGSDDTTDLVATYGKAPPIGQLVSPSEMAADQAKQKQIADAALTQERLTPTIAPPHLSLPATVTTTTRVALVNMPPAPPLKVRKQRMKLAAATATTTTTVVTTTTTSRATISPAPSGWANQSGHSQPQQPSAFSRFFSSIGSGHTSSGGMDTPANNPSNEWGYKFLQTARALGDRGIDYDDDWRPPGERSSWVMDCSNTSRWLYKSVAGINLPRTASDQYYYLHQQGKAWDVPQDGYGLPDVAYLQHNLKPGDLLFWENTYRPERQPPITHVMVFLGTNERGQWIMAGSQGSGGEHGRRDGGPDVYIFRPSQPCGGYTSWFVHHKGRFCAFGRPLEADPSKFALND